jgi:hypothetical protein
MIALVSLGLAGCVTSENLSPKTPTLEYANVIFLDPAEGYDEDMSNPPAAGHLRLAALASSTVEIVNLAIEPIDFQMRPLNGQWEPYTILSGANTIIGCRMCSTEQFDVSIATDGHEPVVKTLNQRKRYKIFWNATLNVWDIEEITRKK